MIGSICIRRSWLDMQMKLIPNVMFNIFKMENVECNVCYEEGLELVSPKGFGELKCTHYLCENCWKEIAKTKTECPMCREDVRKWMIEMKYVSVLLPEPEAEETSPRTGIR